MLGGVVAALAIAAIGLPTDAGGQGRAQAQAPAAPNSQTSADRYPDIWWWDPTASSRDNMRSGREFLYHIHSERIGARFGSLREVYEHGAISNVRPIDYGSAAEQELIGLFGGEKVQVTGLFTLAGTLRAGWRLEPDDVLRKAGLFDGYEIAAPAGTFEYVGQVPFFLSVDHDVIPARVLESLIPRLDRGRIVIFTSKVDVFSYNTLQPDESGPDEPCYPDGSALTGVRLSLANGSVKQEVLWKKVAILIGSQQSFGNIYCSLHLKQTKLYHHGMPHELQDGTYLLRVSDGGVFRIDGETGCTRAPPQKVRLLNFDEFDREIIQPLFEFGGRAGVSPILQAQEFERLLDDKFLSRAPGLTEQCR